MAVPKAPVLLPSRAPRTLVTPSVSSTAMTGKDACWRFARIGLLVHQVAVTKVVAVLEVARGVVDIEVDLVAREVVLEATADVEATEVAEVDTAVHLLEVSMTLLLLALPLRHRTPSPTTLHREENRVS